MRYSPESTLYQEPHRAQYQNPMRRTTIMQRQTAEMVRRTSEIRFILQEMARIGVNLEYHLQAHALLQERYTDTMSRVAVIQVD